MRILKFLFILLFFLVLVVITVISINFEHGEKLYDPWGDKGVLSYLFLTADEKLEKDVKKLQEDLHLTNTQMERLKSLAVKEQRLIKEKAMQYKDPVKYNDELDKIMNNIDQSAQNILIQKYKEFRRWVRYWWKEEVEYRNTLKK